MKKQLLLSLAVSIAIGVAGQTSHTAASKVVPKVKASLANKAEPYQPAISDADAPSFQTYVNALQSDRNDRNNRAFTSTIIGTSIYDLQTNASVCNRVVLNADGTIGATWTMAHGNTPTPSNDRGTGYNYFNGSSWGIKPTTRLESARCGWPNIAVTGTGGEVVVSHEALASGGNIYVLTRPVKGTGAWIETKMGYPDVWSRMAVGGANGNTIHLISQTTGVSPGGNPPFYGQDGAIAYSRSLDGGITWDKNHTVIPQIDSSFYLGFGGDNYAIDTKGDTIVIVAGGMDVDVVMIKSIDNGTTWTKTIIKQFPIAKFNSVTMITDTLPKNGVADTLETNDGSVAVLIDHQGKAHVWYGRMRVVCATPGTAAPAGLLFFPFTDGLMYWNENIGNAPPVLIAAASDIDEDNIINVTEIGTYYVSLTSMPSAGIDAQGKIFVSYASIYEGIAEGGAPGDGRSFRHTYVIRSDDGGATWCTPIDVDDPAITDDDYREGVFGAIARKVNDNVHLVYEEDTSPGHGLSVASGSTTPGSQDPQSGYESDIIYVKIPVADFVCAVGIDEKREALSNITLYPNPASASVALSFTITHPTKADVAIYNTIGQKIAGFSNELSVTGTHTLNINTANYNPGIYFVNSVIEGKVISKKLVIE